MKKDSYSLSEAEVELDHQCYDLDLGVLGGTSSQKRNELHLHSAQYCFSILDQETLRLGRPQ